jgi:hypothetical protein
MIKINGVKLPTPTNYSVGIQDLSKAERNVKGTMIIERIATKRKIEIGWNYLNANDLSNILQHVSQTFFTVEYIDPIWGVETKTFYCGDRSAGALDYRNGVVRWKDIKFNLVER